MHFFLFNKLVNHIFFYLIFYLFLIQKKHNKKVYMKNANINVNKYLLQIFLYINLNIFITKGSFKKGRVKYIY